VVAYCPSPSTLRLELLDGSGNVAQSLDLMDAAGNYRVSSLELAWPAVREVKASLPTRDGEWDTTSLFGERVVTILGSILSSGVSRQSALNALASWAMPGLRPRLVYAVDGQNAPTYLGLRGSSLSAPFTDAAISAFTVSWVAPDPIAYALQPSRLVIQPGLRASGRIYPLRYPRTFGLAGPGSYGAAVNAGSYQTWPVFTVFGPCTDPVIDYVAPSDGYVGFKGLTVAAGDHLVIDTRAATVYYNGSPGASRFSFLDFLNTVWRPFQPGSTGLIFAPASSSGACLLQVDWSSAYLT